ncbi:hypothetical protein KSP40_PGU019127 [Platanthera guangdongensis]|uniref:Uncharacterized protein n=1 Tax=Platanthera guangdongensis TaxID=2320717 RepID=A0ABR2LL11_9ASPA
MAFETSRHFTRPTFISVESSPSVRLPVDLQNFLPIHLRFFRNLFRFSFNQSGMARKGKSSHCSHGEGCAFTPRKAIETVDHLAEEDVLVEKELPSEFEGEPVLEGFLQEDLSAVIASAEGEVAEEATIQEQIELNVALALIKGKQVAMETESAETRSQGESALSSNDSLLKSIEAILVKQKDQFDFSLKQVYLKVGQVEKDLNDGLAQVNHNMDKLKTFLTEWLTQGEVRKWDEKLQIKMNELNRDVRDRMHNANVYSYKNIKWLHEELTGRVPAPPFEEEQPVEGGEIHAEGAKYYERHSEGGEYAPPDEYTQQEKLEKEREIIRMREELLARGKEDSLA